MSVRRGRIISRTLGFSLALAVIGACGGLYAGAPEKVKRPTKKPEPDAVAVTAQPIKMIDDCPAKFQEDPKLGLKQHRSGERSAGQKVAQADELLDKAHTATNDKIRAGQTVEAINKLRQALLDDPYHADATYKLAHAYAITRRKGCALALLKRLNDLQKYGDFAADAKRKIDEAEADSVFQPFRKDANSAINR
jgi:hypothetical protein